MDMTAFREEINKLPFQPFWLRLSDGSRVPVPHQEFIAIAPPRTVFVGRVSGGYETLDLLHIVAIDRSTPVRSRRQGKGRNGPKVQ